MLAFDGSGVVNVDLDRLIASRLLLQANSGGGKSHALRYMLEQTHGRVQQLVLDPEGEFASLRERFPYVLAAKGGDVPADPRSAGLLCRRLIELGASAVIDLYELKLPDRRRFVRVFLEELMHLSRTLWHPVLVVLDEAHNFAPERGSGEAESTEAVIALATQGRKRGFCLVAATQRLSKLHKDVAAELLNKMIGRTGLDIDARRAGDEIGYDKEQRAGLRTLTPGEFYVYGPAITNEVRLVRTGRTETSHPKAGAVGAAPPPPPEKVKKLLAQLTDLPKEAEAEVRSIDDAKKRITQLERELRSAQRGQPAPDPAAAERAAATARVAAEQSFRRSAAGWRRDGERCVQVLRDGAGKLFYGIDRLAGVFESMALDGAPSSNGHAAPAAATATAIAAPRPIVRAQREPETVTEGLTGPEQRILDAIAWSESVGVPQPEQPAAAFLAGYRFGGGAWNNPRGRLNQKGLVRYIGNRIEMTDEGRALANAPAAPATNAEMHARVLSRLSGPERRILQPLLDAYPESLTTEQLQDASNYGAGGAFSNPRGRLRTLGLIDYPSPGMVIARPLLFPGGA